LSHLHGEARRSGLGNPDRWRRAKARYRRCGSDRGVRGTARSGTPEKQAVASTRASPPKRIGRRETPGPPVSGSRVQARRPRARRKPRRDAGSTPGTGTRSRSSGKQKSVVRIGFRAPRHAERQCVGGRTSSKQTVVALTRAMVSPQMGLGFGWGQKLAEKSAGGRPYRGACTSTRPSETVCESRFAPSKAWHVQLGPVWRRKVSGRCGCKAVSIPRKLAGKTTRWKTSRFVPPFSL
jgi:hypothetical protein